MFMPPLTSYFRALSARHHKRRGHCRKICLSWISLEKERNSGMWMNVERQCLPLLFRACQKRLGPSCSLRHLYIPAAKMHLILMAARYCESIGHTALFSCISTAIASEWKVAFCSYVCLWTAGLEPMLSKCSDWALARPVSLCYTLTPSCPSRRSWVLCCFY